MKELSVEKKAKRYDEILVKLQEAKVDNNVCDDRYCCVIDDIVPELVEYKDERIRKQLLEVVHDFTGDSLWVDYNIHKEDAIKWLEQKGEQKYTKKDIDDAYLKGICDAKKELEKQGEQKPAEIRTTGYWNVQDIEQKTAEWSEEQIKVCKEVYADLLSAKGFDLGTINSELNRLEEDLKKLKA